MIIIDIDWYEKNDCDNFFGHIAQPYITVLLVLLVFSSIVVEQ